MSQPEGINERLRSRQAVRPVSEVNRGPPSADCRYKITGCGIQGSCTDSGCPFAYTALKRAQWVEMAPREGALSRDFDSCLILAHILIV
jgi:hypothetical protein